MFSALAEETAARYMPEDIDAYQVIKFDNGFTAIIKPRGTSPYIAARLIVDVGINDFECSLRELPHLAEHLMFSGYDDLSESDLDGAIASYGGSWNAMTDERQTVYELQFHSNHAIEAIWLLWGMMSETQISQDEFDIAQTVVNSESYGEPGAAQQFMYRNGIFGGHVERAFREYVPGTRVWCEDLVTASTVSLSDVNRLLSNQYTPANMTLVAVGHMDVESFREDIELTFGTWDMSPVTIPPRAPAMPNYNPITYTTRMETPVGQESYVSIEFGIPPAGEPDREDLVLIRNYLETRIFEEFRINDGLAYNPSSYISDYDDYSLLGVDASVRTRDTDTALAIMDSLIEEVHAGAVDQTWIDHIRDSYKLRLATGFESNTSIADYYVRHFERWQHDGRFPKHESRYDAVTIESVKAAAGRYLAPNQSLRFVSQPLVSYTGLFAAVAGLALLILFLWRRRMR